MDDSNAELRKKIGEILAQLGQEKASGKDLKNDATCRELRKTLKRAQRRLSLVTPLPLDQKLSRTERLTDMINKRLGELTQGAKKVLGNPYVHSLRKKLKSLGKRKRKLERRQKKAAESSAPSASPPSPPESP